MADASENGSIRLTIHLAQCFDAGVNFVESVHARGDSIADIKEALAATSQLNQVTNYELVHEGRKLTQLFDDVTTLDEIFGDAASATVTMVERAYSLKAVYDHLRRFRENMGLSFVDYAYRAFGVGVGSSNFSSVGLKDVDTRSAVDKKSSGEKDTASAPDPVGHSEEELLHIKEHATVAFGGALASQFANDSLSVLSKWTLPIRSLTLSQWNPPPPPRRLKGDLLYLTLSTLENETFVITCHVSGFYVSRISNTNFNPAVKSSDKGVAHKHYVLHNLVSTLSLKFCAALSANKAVLHEATKLPESYLIPSQVVMRFPWVVSQKQVDQQIVPDFSRVQLPVYANGTDGTDVVKDWNEEYQAIKDFPREQFSERLLREKLLSKCIQEFNQTATATAMDIVHGNLAPLNPNEEPRKHIYLRNNIFYSFGANAVGSHDHTGGDEAARYCFGKDLNSIKILNRCDGGGAHTLLSCVVDYLGERVVCQAPVPGIFNEQLDSEGQPVEKVAYGYAQEKDTIVVDAAMGESMRHIADAFHLKSHLVTLESGSTTGCDELVVSKSTKGIRGTDSRNYVIDLYRTTPLDVAFLDAHYDDSETSYPHKEASMRHELVEEWFKRRATSIFKAKAHDLEQNGGSVCGEKSQIAIPYEEIVFNPDTFAGTRDSDADASTVREISGLVTKHMIPECLDDVSKNSVPVDGIQLTEFLHKFGINMRYLGCVAGEALRHIGEFKAQVERDVAANRQAMTEKTDTKKEKEEKEIDEKTDEKGKPSAAKLYPVVANLTALHNLAVQEIVVRAAKHVLRKQGLRVPLSLKSHFVAHFHNCFLGSDVTSTPSVAVEPDLKAFFSDEQMSFVELDTHKVKLLIETEAYARFRYTLADNWLQDIKRPQAMRELALRFGIQWKAQEYCFNKAALAEQSASEPVETVHEPAPLKGRKKKHAADPAPVRATRTTTFVADDVVAFVPVVKDSSYRCALVDEVFETAKQQLQQGNKDVGLSLCLELLSFYKQIYGDVHVETADFYSSLAHLYAENDMAAEACIVARKAVILNERLRGIDSFETANAYVKASYYEALNKDSYNSFLLNAKVFAMWNSIYGVGHPNILNIFSNCGLMLENFKLYAEARTLYEQALNASIAMNGELSDISAVLRFRLGVFLCQRSLFEEAMAEFSVAARLFGELVGPDDQLTRESAKFFSSIYGYLEYQKQERERKSAPKPVLSKKAGRVPNGLRAGKRGKSGAVAVNPELALKSVDEILRFIEGDGK